MSMTHEDCVSASCVGVAVGVLYATHYTVALHREAPARLNLPPSLDL